MSYPFIVRYRQGEYLTSPRVQVEFKEVRKVTGKVGPFNEVKKVGVDRSHLTVYAIGDGKVGADDRKPVQFPNGHSVASRYGNTVDNNSAGVKQIVRRLSEADQLAIDAVDDQIAALQKEIYALRQVRVGVVQSAWRRATEIPVHDLRPGNGEERRVIDG